MIEVANPDMKRVPPVVASCESEVLDTVRTLMEMDAKQIQIIDDRSGSGGWLMYWWLP